MYLIKLKFHSGNSEKRSIKGGIKFILINLHNFFYEQYAFIVVIQKSSQSHKIQTETHEQKKN